MTLYHFCTKYRVENIPAVVHFPKGNTLADPLLLSTLKAA